MRATALAALALIVVACGNPTPKPSPSSFPSVFAATPSPTGTAGPVATPLTTSYAVLATPPGGPATNHTVSIVDASGKVAASATAANRSGLACTFGQQQAGVVLPSETLSATDDRVYFLDGNTDLKWLAPDGSHGTANAVPGGGSVASTFAVSPDDRRLAVVSADYSINPIPYRIYLEDVGGGNRTQIFSATSNNLVPRAMGWHGGQLVLGYAPACSQGGGPFSGFPTEIHVIDPATAVRSATLGSSSCPVESPPSPAGALCLQQSGGFSVLGWDGKPQATITFGPDQYFSLALSPLNGAAACCDHAGGVLYVGHGTTAKVPGGARSLGFIDDVHLLLGGDTAQDQPRIYFFGAGTTTPINALGDFLARLPGGL